MSNSGFGPGALGFFDELADDNSREFWASHLGVFEQEVKAPMATLLESLPEPYQPFRVFRMNRDLRFTKDKSPYKTQHSAISGAGGIDYYVHLDAGGLLAACGIYQMEPDQLERYRAAVDDTRAGRALERILAVLKDTGSADDLGGEALKSAPRGYPRDHPRIDLLRRKGVTTHRTLAGPTLADGAAVRAFVIEAFETAQPLRRWLVKHVGSAAMEGSRSAQQDVSR